MTALTPLQQHGEAAMHWLASLQAVGAQAASIIVTATGAAIHLSEAGQVPQLLDRRALPWRLGRGGVQVAELEAGVVVTFRGPEAGAQVPA